MLVVVMVCTLGLPDLRFCFETRLQDEAPRLWKDMSHPASPRRPYWDILPANGSVFSYYNMLLQYLPFVQHAATVSLLLA
jgi:hypothetical protein